MIKDFKFFHGYISSFTTQNGVGRMRAEWTIPVDERGYDAENTLSQMLSQRIAEEIDNEIINTLLGNIQYNQRA